MGFSNQERINLLTKALAAGVLDANSFSVWYESFFPFRFINEGSTVWLELPTLRLYPAANLTVARANAALPALATILEDISQPASAVRLTAVTGTNGSTWTAYNTYGDPSSDTKRNWVLPQLVSQANGMPSNGYSIRLYEGDPNAGGVEITTSAGTTGVGDEKTVGWIWNYANGMLLLSEDFKASVTNPYVLGFRYIGRTSDDTDADLQALETTVGGIQTTVTSQGVRLTAAEGDIDTLQDGVGDLQVDVVALQGDMTTVQGDVVALDTRVTTAEGEIDTLQTEVADLQHSVVGMHARFVRGG